MVLFWCVVGVIGMIIAVAALQSGVNALRGWDAEAKATWEWETDTAYRIRERADSATESLILSGVPPDEAKKTMAPAQAWATACLHDHKNCTEPVKWPVK
jgi:hypothetical protein